MLFFNGWNGKETAVLECLPVCHVHLHVIEVDPPTAREVSVIVSTVQMRKQSLRVRNLSEITG